MDYIEWDANRISRMVLGTVQLGMLYGIANDQGQPPDRLASEIVVAARQQGVNSYDTAQAYGTSETVLGQALERSGRTSDAILVSKLSPDLDPCDKDSVERSVYATCERLGVDTLWCMMLHRAAWLDVWDDGLGQVLTALQKKGVIRYLGVSAYAPLEARRALHNPHIRVLQVPCNAWDQRMLHEGIFAEARSRDKLCFVRSVFLQGLLTMMPERVREVLPRALPAARKWHALAGRYSLDPVRMAVGFALALNAPLVIGCETVQQVRDNAVLLQAVPLDPVVIETINAEMAPEINESILNPACWEEPS